MTVSGASAAVVNALKSDHFGIEIYIPLMNWKQLLKLKSDHFGIEIQIPKKNKTPKNRLKSDHFGIEIFQHTGLAQGSLYC